MESSCTCGNINGGEEISRRKFDKIDLTDLMKFQSRREKAAIFIKPQKR